MRPRGGRGRQRRAIVFRPERRQNHEVARPNGLAGQSPGNLPCSVMLGPVLFCPAGSDNRYPSSAGSLSIVTYERGMSMSNDDAGHFESVVVESTIVTMHPNGQTTRSISNCTIDSSNLARLAAQAAAAQATQPWCMISGQTNPPATFTTREHFLPEGLGFHWARLPAGLGTCDQVNTTFGAHELCWLRHGAMGLWRPFFVPKGKDRAPAFRAPRGPVPEFTFSRDANGNLILEANEEVVEENISTEGKGTITLTFIAPKPNSTAISMALHKTALLTFWLSNPVECATSDFSDLRRFFTSPLATTYRSFAEGIVPGAAPGAFFRYYVQRTSDHDGAVRIMAMMRIHGLLYAVALIGGLYLSEGHDMVLFDRFEPLDSREDIRTRIRISTDEEGP
jgi:hypothetical protein